MTETSTPNTVTFLRRFLIASLLSLSILLLLTVTVIGGLLYYASTTPHVSNWLESQFSDPENGFSVEIGSLSFGVQKGNSPFELTASAVRISSINNELDIPKVQFVFGLGMLVSGMPDKIFINARSLTLMRADGSWIFSDDQAWLNQYLAERKSSLMVVPALFRSFLPEPNKNEATSAPPLWPQGLRHVSVRADSAKIFIETDTHSSTSHFERIKITAETPDGDAAADTVRLQLGFDQSGDLQQQTGRVEITADANILSGLTTFSVNLEEARLKPLVSLAVSSGMITEVPLALALDGVMTAALDGTLDNRKVQLLAGRVSSAEGAFSLPARDMTNIGYSELEAEFAYSRTDNLVNVVRTSVLLGKAHRLTLSGQVLGVHSSMPLLSMKLLAEEIYIADLVSFWPENWAADKRAQLANTISGGRFRTASLAFEGQLNRAEHTLRLSSAHLQGEFASVRLDAHLPQYRQVVGTLRGSVDVELEQSGQIARALLDTTLQNGFVSLEGFDKPVRVPEALLVMRYEPGQLQIFKVSADFADLGTLGAKIDAHLVNPGTLADAKADMSVSVTDVDIDFFKALWPKGLAEKTYGWVRKHIFGGVISSGAVQLAIDGAEHPASRVTDISGTVELKKTSFKLYPDLQPFRQVDATLIFADNLLRVTAKQTNQPAFSVKNANVTLSPLYNPDRLSRALNISLALSGELSPLLTILDHPRINRLVGTGLSPLASTGITEATFSATGTVPPGQKFILSDIVADATIDNAVIGNLPFNKTLEDGALVVSYDNDAIIISGSAVFDGIYSDFSYERKQNGEIELNAKVPADAAFAKTLSRVTGHSIQGSVGGRFALSGIQGGSSYSLLARTDITAAGISIDGLNWAKLPGETGQASGLLKFENGKLSAIEAIDVMAGSLSGKGRLAFQPDGQISLGYFENVVFPGNELKTILLEKTGKSAVKLTAEGSLLNLVPLRRNEGVAKGIALEFDVTASRIIAGPKITLSGNLKGSTQKNGDGRATLLGSLIYASNPLLKEGTIDAQFGPSGEVLEGLGLIGGGEAKLSYRSTGDGRSELEIRSQNGGRVLKGLNIVDSISDGSLTLVTRYLNPQFSEYDTQIDIKDFSVTEAPRAIRAFSVLSLAGLYSLVEGSGTKFIRGEAKILSREGQHKLEKVRATGNAVGVLMLGQFNRQTGEVDVSGNLVPVNQVNKLLGLLPLVGEVLTGIDKSGLFTTQFSVRGNIDDPDVSVNASSLAPGLLRDLFSPDWLGNEAGRILGIEQN